MKENFNKEFNVLILFIIFVAFVSCGNALARTFLSGVQMKGSDVTEPNPNKSKYLKTYTGGFGVSGNDAFYQVIIEITRPFDRTMAVKVEFYDPTAKNQPIVYENEIPIGHETLTLNHGPVKGLRIFHNYWVRVSIFELGDRNKPIDVLKQNIRSYVDTTTSKIGFYSDLEVKN